MFKKTLQRAKLITKSLSVAAVIALAAPATAQVVRVHGEIHETKPVNFRGNQPGSYAVHGIDVAKYQGQINWRQVQKAGVSFAFIKATEGGDLLDTHFSDHWRGAGRAGIKRGAYHFYYFCTSPQDQAAWFIRNVPRARGDLPPVLDMEWNPFSPTCKRRPPAAEVRREMQIFMQIVGKHYGRRPIIYTTPRFYRENQLSKMGNEAFWLRSTAKSLAEAYPGQSWVFWQHSMTGRIPGVGTNVDLNVFAGSKSQWKSWLGKSALR